jgi:hypothetical protein
MNGPTWNLSADRRTVTLTFPTDPPVALHLDAAKVDDLLARLGEFRASMEPETPRDFALGQKVGAIPDPRWVTEPDLMYGASLLHLRDPRFGWLHYLFPPHEARNLARLLQAQADNQPPGPPPGRTN